MADIQKDFATLAEAVIPHDTNWAIEAVAGKQLWSLLSRIEYGAHAAQYREAQSVWRSSQDDKPAKAFEMAGDVAVLTVSGPMTKSPTSFSMGTSTVRMRRQVRLAAADPDVKSIVIRIDSPGGTVSGTGDLAADIAKARTRKPVIAYVEDCCASAAYWIASQCTEIHSNATALIGSIGTYLVIDDTSKAAWQAGVEVLVFSTGKYKGAGVDGAAVTPEQRQHFQERVDGLNAHFLAGVAAGRGMTADEVAEIADGRTFIAADALNLKLIDKIDGFDECLDSAQMGAQTAAATGGKGQIMDPVITDPAKADDGKTAPPAASSANATPDEMAKMKAELEGLKAEKAQLAKDKAEADSKLTEADKIAKLQDGRISALETQAKETTVAHQLEKDLARIDTMVETFKILPSAKDKFVALAKEDPAAFAKTIEITEANGPVVPVARQIGADGKIVDAAAYATASQSGSAEQAKLQELATAKAEKDKSSYSDAMKAVLKENPDLAIAVAAARS